MSVPHASRRSQRGPGLRRFGRRTSVLGGSMSHTFDVLHTANLATPILRRGFAAEHLREALPFVGALAGTPAVAIVDPSGALLAVSDALQGHEHDLARLAQMVADERRPQLEQVHCSNADCQLHFGFGVPLLGSGRMLGALVALDAQSEPTMVRTLTEVAHWLCAQTEFAELDEHRTKLARAELRALRAQISPHFIFNALSAVASFIRTDPDRARELLIEFADFTRYSLRNQGEFTTVAEELKSIERYLVIEKARFGERLSVTLRVAPEVLSVVIPFLVVQPLVENAIRHGIERRDGSGRLQIFAFEESQECVIVVEDNGAGVDPEHLRTILNTSGAEGEHIGLSNVDDRLRAIYGPSAALQIDTGVNLGTKVSFRVPKYRPGVRV
jgi:two-component system, LytTR family, sensor kinase